MDIDIQSVFIVCAIIGLIPAFIAAKKGKNFLLWWLMGSLVWIVALPLAILIKPEQKVLDQTRLAQGMKKCPYCAEIIRGEAIVCRYCGHAISLSEDNKIEEIKDTTSENRGQDWQGKKTTDRPKIRFIYMLLLLWLLVNVFLFSHNINIDIKPYFSESVLAILKIVFLLVPTILLLWIVINVKKHRIKVAPLIMFLCSLSIAILFSPTGPQTYRIKRTGGHQEVVYSYVKLNAKVSYDGNKFVISNNDKFDWKNVSITIKTSHSREYTNPAGSSPTFSIKAGQSYELQNWQFFEKGKSLPFFRTDGKPEIIEIRCTTKSGKLGTFSDEQLK